MFDFADNYSNTSYGGITMILNANDYWARFEQSGRIDDYMAFKNMSQSIDTGEELINADNDTRYSNT